MRAAVLMAAGVVARVGHAQAPLSLDAALARALRDNPDLRAARARVAASRGDATAAREYPNPSLSVSPGNPFQYLATIPIDLGPQRLYRVRAARSGAAAAAFDAENAERQVRFAVCSTFVSVVYADSMLAVRTTERDLFRELLVADSARVQAGDAPARVLARSEVELARADGEVLQAAAARRAAAYALQALMGVPEPRPDLRVVGDLRVAPLAVDTIAATDAVLSRRPDVAAARQRTLAGRSGRWYAIAQLLPTPQLAVVQQRTEPFPNGQHMAFGVSMDLPVWNWLRGERARANASLAEAEANEAQVRLSARNELEAVLDQYRVAATVAARFGDGLVARAASALDDARYAYAHGAMAYVELLDAVRAYGEVRAAALAAARDHTIAAYALIRATGADAPPK